MQLNRDTTPNACKVLRPVQSAALAKPLFAHNFCLVVFLCFLVNRLFANSITMLSALICHGVAFESGSDMTNKPAKKPVSPMEYPIHELQVLARMQRELLSAEQIDQEKAQILASVIEEKLAKMRAAWNQALSKKSNTRAAGTCMAPRIR